MFQFSCGSLLNEQSGTIAWSNRTALFVNGKIKRKKKN